MTLVARFLSAVLMACAFNSTAFAESAGKTLVFDETRFDLGTVRDIAPIPHTFSFTNRAEKNIRVISVTPSCGCTAAAPAKTDYAPGERGGIAALFDPAGISGKHETTVVVEDSAGGKQVLTLTATVETMDTADLKVMLPPPSIKVTPEKVDLGKMEVGKAMLFKAIVENAGDGDLFITNFDTPNDEGIRLSQKPIARGKKIELTLYYMVRNTGKIKDSIVIRSNDPKRPEVKITIIGKGVAPKPAKKK